MFILRPAVHSCGRVRPSAIFARDVHYKHIRLSLVSTPVVGLVPLTSSLSQTNICVFSGIEAFRELEKVGNGVKMVSDRDAYSRVSDPSSYICKIGALHCCDVQQALTKVRTNGVDITQIGIIHGCTLEGYTANVGPLKVGINLRCKWLVEYWVASVPQNTDRTHTHIRRQQIYIYLQDMLCRNGIP